MVVMTDELKFWVGLCAKMGLAPTEYRVAVFDEWERLEDRSGHLLPLAWNPLATSRLSDATPLNMGYDIGYGPGNYNWVPVRVYKNMEAGIQATYETLQLSYYPNVRLAFVEQAASAAAAKEIDESWVGSPPGVPSYGHNLIEFMYASTASKTALVTGDPIPPDTDRIARLERLVGGYGVDTAGVTLTGEAALRYMDEKVNASLFKGLALTQDALVKVAVGAGVDTTGALADALQSVADALRAKK